MTDLTGKHVLVTGGGKGIGEAVARRLAADGAKVTVLGRSLEPLLAVASSLPQGQALSCDVTDEAAVNAAIQEAVEVFGPVEILVNNAGAALSAPFLKQTGDDLRRMLEINTVSTWTCTQAVLGGMVDRGWGRVVNVASTAGLKAYPYVASYVMAKHAVVGLTRTLALELARKGVTVNAVCPGYTETDMVRGAVQTIIDKTGRSEDEARMELAKNNPQKRLVQPDEVAETVSWLCGANSDSINGQSIAIAGGEVM
ncbi:SDR family NAD(P)-dependent oxidoreductase [Aestuariispira ectoiniformans]|uniref:SDR family NAD(P)-dependent oxidoreductase n=1 Tax=Aestuariispira ectoiniformans TaxID=2775080 RepID=UPI00223B9371|nr:SDR family NAD(P)-dependent oxidoreductase [Aestuariispira ectoiniformans]